MPLALFAANDDTGGSSTVVFAIFGWIVTFLFYMIPSIIAVVRKHPNVGPIIVINIFLGWSCVGWIIALAWCFSSGGGTNVTVHTGDVYDDDPPPRRRRRRRDYDDDEDE